VDVIPDLVPFEQTCQGFTDCVISLKDSMLSDVEAPA